jgi:hypothetical protein
VALLRKRQGESCGQPGRDERCIRVEEARASHPSSMGNRSEAGGWDVSEGNGAGAGGARIRADGAEQPWASGQALVLLFAQ